MDSSVDNRHIDKTKVAPRKQMSHEERLKLAEKLDKDLDNFIASLEKKRYSEGWPADKWEEEMEKHPFFMSKPPAEGEELPPLLAGLQQLKYDESENSSEELASTYKDDGNMYFKNHKYRLAILSYTAGIKQKCANREMNATLYNNRGASHFCLQNYRSAYNDSKRAVELKSDYVKAVTRVARCCLKLKRFSECVDLCDQVYTQYPTERETVSTLKQEALAGQADEQLERKAELVVRLRKDLDKLRLVQAMKQRGISFLDKETDIFDSPLSEAKVHFDPKNRLVWPVVLMYPEYKTSDIIKEFHEDSRFDEVFQEVFAETADWDTKGTYTADSVSVYFEDKDGKIHRVSRHDTLASAITHKSYYVDKGTPVFFILVKNSDAETYFLEGTL